MGARNTSVGTSAAQPRVPKTLTISVQREQLAFGRLSDQTGGEVEGLANDNLSVRIQNVWFAQAHRCGLGVELEVRAAMVALFAAVDAPARYVFVNLSPAALRSDELRARLPADLVGVVIEITEHELVADGERTRATLADLRARGARIAVDDAGAGYAGLRQLMVLRPDLIKLDRGLIENVATDQAKQALVECFVRFAERTDATVCAEGIESLDDLLALARLDVRPQFGWAAPAPEACDALGAGPALLSS